MQRAPRQYLFDFAVRQLQQQRLSRRQPWQVESLGTIEPAVAKGLAPGVAFDGEVSDDGVELALQGAPGDGVTGGL